MFLGGFFGTEEQWASFDPKWREALGPQRRLLHMHRLRWNSDSTRRLLERLGSIPNASGLTPVLGGLRFGDYEDLVVGTPDERLLKGYLACIAPMVIQILKVVPDNDCLELIFEEQPEYQHYANLALQISVLETAKNQPWAISSDGRPKLAKWTFVSKGSTARLDPADYFVFALGKLYTDPKSKKAEWCKPILQSGGGKGIGSIMHRKMIRTIIMNTQLLAQYRTLVQRLNMEFRVEGRLDDEQHGTT